MNRYPPPEHSYGHLEKHLRVLQHAPPPDLTRGRARVLAEMDKRRARVSQMPRRVTFAMSLGAGLAVMLVMTLFVLAFAPGNVATVAMTRTDTLRAETFAPAAQPGSAQTPLWNADAPRWIAGTPAPNIVPEPPHAPSLTNTRPSAPFSTD
jgi:hypothetical protein